MTMAMCRHKHVVDKQGKEDLEACIQQHVPYTKEPASEFPKQTCRQVNAHAEAFSTHHVVTSRACRHKTLQNALTMRRYRGGLLAGVAASLSNVGGGAW